MAGPPCRSDGLSLDVPAQLCSQLSRDPEHFWTMAETWREMRRSAEGDDPSVARAEVRAATEAVGSVLGSLPSLGGRAERYEPFLRSFARTGSLEAAVRACDAADVPARAASARLDHVRANGRWLFLSDFNNKGQGWSAMHRALLEDHARALFLALWKRYRARRDAPPRSLLVVHGRQRDELGFETVDLARAAIAQGLFAEVGLAMESPEWSLGDGTIIAGGRSYDVAAVLGGRMPPVPFSDDRFALFPDRRIESLADRKWEVGEVVARFAEALGVTVEAPRSLAVAHSDLAEAVGRWGGEEGRDLVVVKNGVFGSGKGVYLAPPDADAAEHARALFHLHQLRTCAGIRERGAFERLLLQEAVHTSLMEDGEGVGRIHDCTPRTGFCVPLGTVGRLARLPYDPRVAERTAAFFRAHRGELRALAEAYSSLVSPEGVPGPDATAKAQALEGLDRLVGLYDGLRGVFVVSGARTEPGGRQVVDSGRVYTAFTRRHLRSLASEGGSAHELMVALYRQCVVESLAVDLFIEEGGAPEG